MQKLILNLFLLFFSFPCILSENKSKLQSLHSLNAFGVLHDTIPDLIAFQDLKNSSNLDFKDFLLKELNKFGINTDQLLKLFIQASFDKCFHDLSYTAENVLKPDAQQLWAIRLLDSYGKLGSGILSGNFKWIGDFNECVNVYAPYKENSSIGNFHGQYCTLQVSFNLSGTVLPLSSGVCLPDSCKSTTLTGDLWKLLNATGLEPFVERFENVVNFTSLDCKPNSKQYTSAAIFMICFLVFFGLLAFIGSSLTVHEYIRYLRRLDGYDNLGSKIDKSDGYLINVEKVKDSHENISTDDEVLVLSSSKFGAFLKHCRSFFKCFCVFTNGKKLLDTSSSEGQLLSIHGIRFLSMCWVIICHVYMAPVAIINNMAEVPKLVDNWPFLVILQGFYSVDSFFVLSGFLMAYLFFQDYDKRGRKIPWLAFYVHRYVRLTPVYAIMIGYSTALFTYLGSGPFWPDYEIEPFCQENWWWNLLYINNFSPMAKQCVAWSWYLANDMQFFVISPIFLITLFRWPKIGFSLLGLSFCGTFAANFGITYHYDLITGLAGIGHFKNTLAILPKITEFFDYVYIKPYTRIGPYLVGISLGYYLFKKKQQSQKRDSWIFLACGWFLSTAVTLICIFSLYHRDLSLLERSFYNAFHRTCYAASLSWVIYACLTGQGGPVNTILSFKMFMPLSRLTYVAYLIHPLVVSGFISSMRITIPFAHITVVTLFFGLLVVTYALSMAVSLLFESPIIQLEKFIRGKKS